MRKVREDDWQAVFHLVQDGRSTWPNAPGDTLDAFRARMKNQNIWITENTGGFISWLPESESPYPRLEAREDDIHLSSFFVRTDLWGSGLAAEMMEFLLSSTRGSHIRLWTPSEAHRSRAFYEKMGFCEGRELWIVGIYRTEYLRESGS